MFVVSISSVAQRKMFTQHTYNIRTNGAQRSIDRSSDRSMSEYFTNRKKPEKEVTFNIKDTTYIYKNGILYMYVQTYRIALSFLYHIVQS